jgi:hypothetical protein
MILNERTDKIPPDAIYVGRPSPFGNPFVIGRDGDRLTVIRLYREWLAEKMLKDPAFAAEVHSLAGRDLVCWCSPAPCHADVLAEVAE